jgi:Putative zinc-finger
MAMMEHSEAIRRKAAEQYLLGELTGELREQYEEHFFSCQECAEEVKVGVAFIGGAKQVLGREKPSQLPGMLSPPGGRGWLATVFRPAFAVQAMAILLAIVFYQNAMLIPRMKTSISPLGAPQTLTSLSLLQENSRGGAAFAATVSPNRPFGLYLDIPPGKFRSYVCEIETESGTPEISLPVSQQEAAATVQLLIPPARLRPGKHFLVVRGFAGSQAGQGEGVEVARYSFALNFK